LSYTHFIKYAQNQISSSHDQPTDTSLVITVQFGSKAHYQDVADDTAVRNQWSINSMPSDFPPSMAISTYSFDVHRLATVKDAAFPTLLCDVNLLTFRRHAGRIEQILSHTAGRCLAAAQMRDWSVPAIKVYMYPHHAALMFHTTFFGKIV
jgi:hypothetical protein